MLSPLPSTVLSRCTCVLDSGFLLILGGLASRLHPKEGFGELLGLPRACTVRPRAGDAPRQARDHGHRTPCLSASVSPSAMRPGAFWGVKWSAWRAAEMSLQSQPPGVGHTEETGPLRWLGSREHPGTRRSHLHPTGSCQAADRAEIYRARGGGGEPGGLPRGGPTRPELLLWAPGSLGLCPMQGPPVPTPNGGGHGLH